MSSGRRLAALLGVLIVAVVGFVLWKRPAESTPSGSASASALPPDLPTIRMRREMLRTKVLTAILDEASAPPPRTEPERKGRSLTKALVGVPEVHFPDIYAAYVYAKLLAPLTRKCIQEAQARKPSAGASESGSVSVRYVVVSAPRLGAYVEDATVDESSLDDDDLEECIHEGALDLTFDPAPEQGGFEENAVVRPFGDAGTSPGHDD